MRKVDMDVTIFRFVKKMNNSDYMTVTTIYV